jgi:hypothetical protein
MCCSGLSRAGSLQASFRDNACHARSLAKQEQYAALSIETGVVPICLFLKALSWLDAVWLPGSVTDCLGKYKVAEPYDRHLCIHRRDFRLLKGRTPAQTKFYVLKSRLRTCAMTEYYHGSDG